MLRMKSKVKIISEQKTDGRHNYGTVIGVELIPDAHYLGFRNEKEYIARHNTPRYKVAYVDCVTKRACTGWYTEHEIELGRKPKEAD